MSVVTVAHPRAARDRVSPHLLAAAAAALVAYVAHTVFSSTLTGDYVPHGQVAGDNAALAIAALRHGRLASMVAHQPLMGLTSLALRAAVTAVVSLFSANEITLYQAGAFACLAPLIGLLAWMVVRPGESTERRVFACLAAAIVVGSPAVVQAVRIGHPEEVLAITLATAAVLAAQRGHRNAAPVLLGLAVGAKQWALLMAPCVLLALPDRRLAAALKAGAVTLLLAATLPLADPAAFSRADAAVGGIRFADIFSPWWRVGSAIVAHAKGAAAPTSRHIPLGLTRSLVTAAAVAAGGLGLWVYGRRATARGRKLDPLALLAVVGLLRCVADPDPLQYNFVDLLVPVAIWETISARRFPIVSAVVAGLIALLDSGVFALYAGTDVSGSPATVNAIAIACELALVGYLAHRSFTDPSPA